MAYAIYKTKKYLLIVSKLSSGDIFVLCMAYFIIPIDIVGYKSYNPIMFVGIIGITGESPDLSGDNIYFSEA